MADGDLHSNRPGPLQSLRLLADDVKLETKRSNEGDPSQSETSECLEFPSPSRVEIGATEADLSLGVGAEMARRALRRRLAGEDHRVHKRQVPRARVAQTASSTLNGCRRRELHEHKHNSDPRRDLSLSSSWFSSS
jgi:hypothetical protein